MSGYSRNRRRLLQEIANIICISDPALSLDVIADTDFEEGWYFRRFLASDFPEYGLTKAVGWYWSAEHALEGDTPGILFGQADDFDLTNFTVEGIVFDAFFAETQHQLRLYPAETGITDTIAIYVHELSNPANSLVQETVVFTTSGGALPHLATFTRRGNPINRRAFYNHTGYLINYRRGISDYVGFGLDNSTINTARVYYAENPLGPWRQGSVIDRSKYMPSGGIVGTTFFAHFMYEGTMYCMSFYQNNSQGQEGVGLFTVDPKDWRARTFLHLVLSIDIHFDIDIIYTGHTSVLTDTEVPINPTTASVSYRANPVSPATTPTNKQIQTVTLDMSCLHEFLVPDSEPPTEDPEYLVAFNGTKNESIKLRNVITTNGDFYFRFENVKPILEQNSYAVIFTGTTSAKGRLLISETQGRALLNVGGATGSWIFDYPFVLTERLKAITIEKAGLNFIMTVNDGFPIYPNETLSNSQGGTGTVELQNIGAGVAGNPPRQATMECGKISLRTGLNSFTIFDMSEQTGTVLTASDGTIADIVSDRDLAGVNANVWIGTV